MAISWRYTKAGKSTKKHAFYNKFTISSVCGYSIPWYVPIDWTNDRAGLDSRNKCKRCVNVLMAGGAPLQPTPAPYDPTPAAPTPAEPSSSPAEPLDPDDGLSAWWDS
jgi:hypothetical protein